MIHRKHGICVILAIALASAMVPGAVASHQVGPPEEAAPGGGGDVEMEIEKWHEEDETGLRDDLNNAGEDPTGDLVLNGKYATGVHPEYISVNSLQYALTEGTPAEQPRRIYPGNAWLSAWWGWWADKGSGEALNEIDNNQPPLTSNDGDNVINDGHDNHSTEQGADNDTIYTGQWDEFIWRGENPWAGQTQWDGQLGGKPSYDGNEKEKDTMLAFMHPGTHDNCCSGQDNQAAGGPFISTGFEAGPFTVGQSAPGLLLDNADRSNVPDLTLEDRTGQSATSLVVVPSNGAAYGWLTEFGWNHLQYDQSFFIETKITYAVNPASTGPGTYDRLDTTAHDVDVYESIHPQAETLYRQAVWDPHKESDDQDDTSSPLDDITGSEGAKQAVKTLYSDSVNQLSNDLPQIMDENTRPVNFALGPANDAQAKKPRPHEPNHQNDTGYAAGHDPATTYSAMPGTAYYQPGGNPYNASAPNGPHAGTQTYTDYQDAPDAFFDNQAEWAFPGYFVALRLFFGINAFTSPGSLAGDVGDRSAAPGLLYFEANLGGWQDADGDTFVGNLSEKGRFTSAESPYAEGRVDDPNDYTDTAQETEEDPSKFFPNEWTGADCDASVNAVVRPVGTPTNGDGEHAWGSTNPPVGVYFVEDKDDDNFNPYDEAVGDAVPATGEDTDDEQFSRHVQYGPIPINYECLSTGDTGAFLAQENILMPAGTLDYDIEIEATGTIGKMPFPSDPNANLTGEQVTDVDELVSFAPTE